MNLLGRRTAGLVAAVGLGSLSVVALALPASADGPTTFSNSTAISIPNGSSTDQSGPASPYPSTIAVSGLAGSVSAVTASFNNLTHSSAGDIDAMLVAPDGSNLILMSDPGDPSTLTFANNATLTFSDAAAGSLPTSGQISTGTYKPTNINGGTSDTFPSPAPVPSSQTTLASAFTGVSPNGNWNLYVVDDNTGDVGNMAGGWSLTLTTTSAAAATSTTVSAAPNPATTGQTVTLTATVTSSGSPVTEGTVTFTDGAATIASNVGVDGTGHAVATTSSLTEATHTITATYSGTPTFLGSNGSTAAVVDSPTQVTGSTYCNVGGISVPSIGTSTPYASHIAVSGLSGNPTSVTASVSNINHTFAADLDVLLVGPGGQKVEVLSDRGGISGASGVDLVFADGHPPIPDGALVSGTYAPTNDDTDGPDSFPAPAPSGVSATTMSAFDAGSANGTWSLYVVDDASGDSGSIGSWCVTIQTQAPTTTSLTAQPQRGPSGTAVTLTATVTEESGGNPVTDGSVSFFDVTHGAHVLLGSHSVGADGRAVVVTSTLTPGRHGIRAEYGETASHQSSHSATVGVKIKTVADAGGPYTIAPGDPLHLDASGSTIDGTTRVRWDVNGDGIYTDASGVSPTLSWSDLQALGIQPGQHYTVRVRVRTEDVPAKAKTTLTVTS